MNTFRTYQNDPVPVNCILSPIPLSPFIIWSESTNSSGDKWLCASAKFTPKYSRCPINILQQHPSLLPQKRGLHVCTTSSIFFVWHAFENKEQAASNILLLYIICTQKEGMALLSGNYCLENKIKTHTGINNPVKSSLFIEGFSLLHRNCRFQWVSL